MLRRLRSRNGLNPLSRQILLATALLAAVVCVAFARQPPPPPNLWLRLAGDTLIGAILAAPVGIYCTIYTVHLRLSSRRLWAIFAVIAITTVAARLWLGIAGELDVLFPLPAAIILIALLADHGLAFVAAGLISIALALTDGAALGLSLTLLLGGISGVFAIGRPTRAQAFFRAGVWVALAIITCQLAVHLRELTLTPVVVLIALLGGLVNGLLSAALAFWLYSAVGHLAGAVTPFRLMELSHPSQPLIRRLMRDAPGTYYHSIAVGNLAESAAEAVGADALLLRVGAYYHDIGKLIRPYFFTDNQSDRENVHNELDPQTSAQIIADHVREGIKMARGAHLPEELVDFIATHHGTQVIKQFYQLALQQNDTVDIEAFRYPGPKPQTREQGILMLADSVEATVRSRAQYGQIASAREQTGDTPPGTPGRQTLEAIVSGIIDERFRSGQLDESQLTMRDLLDVRQAFVNTLQGIYHPRVEYKLAQMKEA